MTAARESTEREAELRALREAIQDLVEGCGGLAPARRQLDSGTGYDEQAWLLLGRDMGMAGLGVPENAGGAGGGLAELTVVGEELAGRCYPFRSSRRRSSRARSSRVARTRRTCSASWPAGRCEPRSPG